MFTIYVVSDGTGRTATQALNAALTQFPDIPYTIRVFPEVRTKSDIQNVMDEVLRNRGFVVHTLVTSGIRREMVRAGRLNNVETIDLMGPLLGRLEQQFQNAPSQKPGLFHEINREYFQRIDAMQFAFKHDDGKRPEELCKSEIVLVGVSRTFKTPVSIYLAFKGWFVANVPLVLNIAPPGELEKVTSEKVFFLTTNAAALCKLRKVREEHLGGITGDYATHEYVRKELLFATSVFHRHPGWTQINVTGKSIEEIASEILALRGDRE